MNDIKTSIEKYNKTITNEYNSYEKNRSINLNMIMGCACYVQTEKTEKVIKVASKQQERFPLYNSHLSSSLNDGNLNHTDEGFESIDVNYEG